MAEQRKTAAAGDTHVRVLAQDSEPTAARLLPAAESPDPNVQHLLARRQTAVAIDDQAAADAVTAQLAELGYQ